jgi:catechol 2,3-dioxygenase-like lactoylglutathione lyase family enzyme
VAGLIRTRFVGEESIRAVGCCSSRGREVVGDEQAGHEQTGNDERLRANDSEDEMTVKELGHVVLYVGDVEGSAAFYRDVLGWEPVFPTTLGMPVAAFSSGRTHHELLLIEVGADAAPQPRGRHLGLYHIGLKVGDSDEELREVVRRLHQAEVTITPSPTASTSWTRTEMSSSSTSTCPGSTGRETPA